MLRLYNRFRYFIGNAIAIIVLSLILGICSFGILVIDGISLGYFLYICFVSVLLLCGIFYLICALKDNQIERKGYPANAKIIKTYDIKYRFSPVNNIIIFEYMNNKGKLIRTSENIGKYTHKFKNNEKINVISNGKKCILNRKIYK